MRATVSNTCPYKSITALGGREYVKGEYREIPRGLEEQALRNQYLEIEAPSEESITAVVVIEASNAAVKLADEHGVDLSKVVGTGVNGRILKSDIMTAAGIE